MKIIALEFKHFSSRSGLTVLDPCFSGTGFPSQVDRLRRVYPDLWVDRLCLYRIGQKPQDGLGDFEYQGIIYGRVLTKGSDCYIRILDLVPAMVLERYGKDRQAINLKFLQLARNFGYVAVDLGDSGIVAFEKLPVTLIQRKVFA